MNLTTYAWLEELKRLTRKALREIKNYGKIQDDTAKLLRRLSK